MYLGRHKNTKFIIFTHSIESIELLKVHIHIFRAPSILVRSLKNTFFFNFYNPTSSVPVLLWCTNSIDMLIIFYRLLPTTRCCPFHHRGLECKSRKWRDTWNRLVWPQSTKRSRAKANTVYQENSLVIVNTLFRQHKRTLYTWTSPNGQYQNQTDCILCSQRWRISMQSAEARPGADCGLDHKFLIAKFRLEESRERH